MSRSLETNGQLLPDFLTFEVCHGCLPPHAHAMFEHAHGMFEHVMCMFEHVHDMFEHTHDIFEHNMVTLGLYMHASAHIGTTTHPLLGGAI